MNAHTGDAPPASVAMPVSEASLVHVLVPLVKHFVFENVKVAEKYLQEEAILALAAVAAHLPWLLRTRPGGPRGSSKAPK